MLKPRLLFLIAFAAISKSFAQCPVAGFNVNDTICVNLPFTVTNTSTANMNYSWDFCAGDLKYVPSCTVVGTYAGLSGPSGMDIETDGTNWYGFVANFGTNTISRFDFGNSLDNIPPAPASISAAGLNGPVDVRMINDNGFWYAVVSSYNNNSLVKLDMNTLTNTSPGSNTFSAGVLTGNHQAVIVKDGDNFKALAAMTGGSNTIGIWDFGPSMSNNSPSFSSLALGAAGPAPISISVAKECDQWYGIVPNISDGNIQRIRFGTTISNTVIGIDLIATLPSAARELELANDNSLWYAFVLDVGGTSITRLDFGDSLNSNTITSNVLGGFGQLNGDNEFTLEKAASKWHTFTDGYSTNVLHHISFPDSCSATLITSTDFNPLNPSYTNFGTYNISLTVTDSLGNISFFSDSVVITGPPLVDFANGPACLNSPVSFYDSTYGGGTIISWIWDFGDGDSAFVQNPIHIYTSATGYAVTLTVTSNSGCTATITDSVYVQDSPTADFSFPNNQCANSPVQFTDQSTSGSGSVTAWEWNFDDGTPLDNSQNPVHTFDTAGTFAVQLVAFTSSGCGDTIIQNITIVDGPLADFTVSQTCAGEATLFTNTSSGGGTVFYHWDFGDSNTSTAMNPSNTYPSSPANYNVTLIDSSSNGCMDTVVKNIRISDRANPGFFIIPNILCEGSTLMFIDTSTVSAGDSIISSNWDFGDSNFDTGDTVMHVYATAGPYMVTLTVTTKTSCDTSVSIPVNVIQCPVTSCPITEFIVPDTVCANTLLPIINNSIGGINYEWDFCAGDLKRIPSCVPVDTPSTVSSPSGMDIVTDGTNWYGFIANFGNNSITRLDFGNSLDNIPTDITFSVGLNGPVEIRMVNDNGYWYAIVSNLNPNELVRLNMDSLTNISPSTNAFSAGGLLSPYYSTIVKDKNNYKVLVAMSGSHAIGILDFGINMGNMSPVFTSINIPGTASPIAVTAAKDCDQWYGFVSFIDDDDVMRIQFGDSVSNSIMGTIDPVATITSPGAREIELANDGAGWFAFVMNNTGDNLYRINFDSLLGNPAPSVTQLGGFGLLNSNYEFTLEKAGSKWYAFSDGYSTNIIQKISFPDSCSATVSSSPDAFPQTSYTEEGTYIIGLALSDADGNISFHADSVYVLAAPVAGFMSTPACINTTISFTDTSMLTSGTITSWQWDFGDGNQSSAQNPTHLYGNDTTYIVTLTVTGSTGCSSTITQNITVHNLPLAGFTFIDNQCSRTLIQFNDTSLAPSGDVIAGWEWNFDDGTLPDITQNPQHAFDTSGTFTVQQVVFTNAGCSDTVTHTITILSRPLADFIVSETCIGQTTVFTNTTTGGGPSVFYNWDFGDGSDTTLFSPTHNYPLISQTYTVILIDSSSNGCTDTIIKNVRISTPANPGFIYNPSNICAGNGVQFIDTSTIATGDSIAYVTWDFGDSSPSVVGDTVIHVYADTGTYTITQIVTALTACDTFITLTITVLESPVANFTSTDVCLNAPMYFYDISSIPAGTTVDSITWDFGDGTYAQGDTVTHGYTTAGTFDVIETVYNNLGCYGTVTHQVTVYAIPVADFTFNPLFGCTGSPLNFINLSTVQNDVITDYLWNFGFGATDSVQNPVHIFNNPNTYQVSLIVTSLHGCQATITIPVLVNQSPLFNFTDSSFCIGDYTHFTFIPLNSVPLQAWDWDFGDNLTSQLQNPSHPYALPGIYNVILTVTAQNSCANTVSHSVTINPKPVAGITSDSLACLGTQLTFNDNSNISSGAVTQWSWNFGDGTAIEITQNAFHNYGNDSTFNVVHIVISDAGCSDTANATVTLEPAPVASFTSNPTFGSPPLLVQFNNTSTGATIYQWTFGDGGTDISVSPSHSYADTGYYQVMLVASNIYNCRDTAYDNISVLIPYLDLAVKEVYAFPSNNLVSLKADLVNLGNIPVNKFQISAKIENGSLINEQWISASPLDPGKSLPYAFTARYEIDPLNAPSFYCIEISEVNDREDDNTSNNKKCAAIGDLFELFDIYPNPSNGEVHISMNVPLDGTIDINIYNAGGQLMKENLEIHVTKGYNEFNYSIRHYAKGIYAFVVKYRDETRVAKIAKK